ncbi:MAG: beta strand repeat-containing protein, partial [Gammaproteobacteria bacterium]
MITGTADAGRTPTHRNSASIETCLRVIILSFVALTLFAIPREGAVQPPLDTRVIVGSGLRGQSKVRVFDGDTAAPLPGPLGSFTAFTQNPSGEVRVAGCDLNADGTDDIVVGPGVQKRPEVRVFNGVTGNPFPGPLGSFLAFNESFRGGVYVACGDVSGDTIPDIIAARGSDKPPEVRVFDGASSGAAVTLLGSFLAFDQRFPGGVRVAACDLNQDDRTDIIAGRGLDGQPEVRTFDGETGDPFQAPLGSFLAFPQHFRGGVHVACGDVSGDTIPDIIAARGSDKPPEVRVFDGASNGAAVTLLGSFHAFNQDFRGGVRVAACDLNQDDMDDRTDIIAGRGPEDDKQPEVRTFDGVSGTPLGSFLAFNASFAGGVYVACSPFEANGGPPPENPPAVTGTTPLDGATGITTNRNLTITFNEPVDVVGNWFQVNCPASGVRNVTDTVVTGGPTTFTINPNTDFAPGEICTTTVFAAQVTDQDTDDPPDNMAADFSFGFTTDAAPTVSSTVPTAGATGVAVNTNVTVNFSESVAITATTFGLECPAGTPVPFGVSPAPPGNTGSFTLNPNADLPGGTICTVTVTAAQVTDTDSNDPPDAMVTDFGSTFTTFDVNDPPSFTAGPNQTVNEDAGAQTVNPWATAIEDGDPGVTQALTFNVTNNTNPSLFSAAPSVSPTGVLTYTPAANANGTATITLTLSDDGGVANGGDDTSDAQSFTITVNAVNDAPAFNAGPDQSVDEDSGAQSVGGWASGISPGPADESGQTLTFQVSNDNNALFTVQPAVSPSGTLTYTLAADAFGSANITLTLADDGGVANGGVDTSAAQSFTITVNGVNDAPSFTAGGDQTVLEDAGAQAVAWATGISAGPANEAGQTLNFIIQSNTNPILFSAGPAVSSGGVLTFMPAPNANGIASITLVLQDNGGTANGGVDTAGPQGFTITVMAVNDPPSVTPPAAYAAHAHIGINIPDGATDLFDGSTITDVDGVGAQPFSITAAGPFASANGGSVTIAANGSFSYNPPAGFAGANDTFTYQICDSGVPGTACTNATATVTVSGPRVWFVNNALGAAGDGRLSGPFNTLAAADTAANANGDRIFVFTGASLVSPYTGGFLLFTNQRLIGQGVVDTNFDTALGITPPATSVARPAINGTRPIINGTINLATGNTARGFNVNNTAATGVSGSSATGLTVNQVSVTTTTGVAVSLASSGGTVSFTSVSANGAANGIVLNTTTGSFTVTGTGAAGTGGTIQSTTGPGILLSNAAGISLARMIIQNGGDDGIRGTTVTGFTLTNSTLQNNGNAIGAFNAGDNGLDFTDLLGTASITSSTITGSFHNNIIIRNSTGTLSGLTVTGATISNNVSTTDGDGFLFEASGTANMSVNVSGSTFSAHQGDHFQAAALNSGVLNVIFSGNTLSGGHATALGQGITINAATGVPGYLGSVSYDIDGNTINGAISNAIFVGLGTSAASSSMIGKIRNNIIGTSGSALSCSTQANGVSVDARGNGTHTSAITGNVIRRCFDRGILSEAGDGDSVLNLTVTGNTIDQQVGTLAREAIQTNHGITSTNVFGNVDTNVVCV